MPFATYVARDQLIPGHVAEVTYTFSFHLTRFDKQIEILRQRPRALAGNAETLHFGDVRRFAVTFMPVPAIEVPLFEEFLFSTQDGQIFLFDPYGTPAAPSPKLMSCDREDGGHTINRITSTDDALNADLFEIAFDICERT